MNKSALIIAAIVLICSILGGFLYSKQTLFTYSDPNSNTQVSEKLAKEIYLYKEGKLQSNTVRYQLFLLCASQVVSFHRFYQELSIQQIIDYFRAVQVFSYDEVNTIVQELAETAGNSEEADSLLQKVLPTILCPYKKSPKDDAIYLSPCCCHELYKAIIKKNYKTSWGIYSPETLFDFKSTQIKQMREFQEAHSTKPKFQHSIDTCFVILENSFSKIYNQPANYETPLFFKKYTPSKPAISWEKNIHLAASKGNIKSLQYNIYLVPLLCNLIDNEGNTPVHIASKNGQAKAIDALKEMKADFNIYNKNGNLPIHMVKTKYTLESLIAAGCDINSPNKDGQTALEIQSNPFNKDVIEGLINHGVNILLPNSKGLYWMQYIIHNRLYPVKKQTDIEFLKFVRNIISKCQYEFYTDNEYLRQILEDGVYTSNNNNPENLRNAVNDHNINKIITYLAMGTYPDTFISGVTNLMIVSQSGDIDLVKMFANNYCDPNKVNNDGENSFWIAANKEYYDVATLLQKSYGANINILSNSGQTLLHISYEQGRTKLFNYLLKAGVSPNIKNSKKESVQFIAFLKRDDKVAEKIQDQYNGDINSHAIDGNTLSHLCIAKNDKERLEYLLKRGLKIEEKNNFGYSLFMQAIVSTNNFDICNFLLGKGAKINTQDANGETPFFYICKSPQFDRKKFDFLLEKNCNINIQDYQRDFPISQLIKKQRNDEALLLLDKKANIIDPTSPTEPICVAVNTKNEYWINTLLKHGANAMNSQYPLIERYIKLDFFDFQTLKSMAPFNAAVGAPIQLAIQKGYYNVAHYLWDESDENTRVKISFSVDDQHRIPISTAILHNDEYLVGQLIKYNYDLSTADNIRRTPYIYACMYNRQNWMASIEQYISLENLDVIDTQGNSALTFVANNGLNNIADHLFIKGVNVKGINFDNYGIIRRYNRILDQYDEILKKVINKRDQAQSNLNEITYKVENSLCRINELRNKLNFYNRMSDNDGNPMQDNGQIRKIEMDLRRENQNYQQLLNAKSRAEENLNSWTKSFNNIDGASRETILYNMDRFDNIAKQLNIQNY